MIEQSAPAALGPFTTLQVGGDAERLVTVFDSRELVEACLSVWADGEQWMLLGGGSNVVVSDEGFAGTVIRVESRGVELLGQHPADPAGTVRVRVQAGEPWDDLVAFTVEYGLSGIEALSGIPGSTGAAPIQNIGAYGQEVSTALVAVEFLDYDTGDLQWLPAHDLGFGYRTSVFKRGRVGAVVSLDLRLTGTATPGARDELGSPVQYAQLAGALGVELGARVPVGALRDAVLRLRASKGMVLNADDPDSVSAGSFFTNPLVGENFARSLPPDAPRWPVEPTDPDDPAEAVLVKLSAAWLIEHAGIGRGFALPGSHAAISGKHTLALTNRGGATAAEVSELARFVQWRVQAEFGVNLSPEPVFVGFPVPDDE